MPLRRRALLAAAAAATTAALTGCEQSKSQDPPFVPSADALMPLLAATVALRDRYDAVLTALPALRDRLAPLREDHDRHVVALAREIGLPERGPFPAPSGTASAPASLGPVPGDQAAALSDLAKLEKDGRAAAEAACLAAPAYRAELLGSITACRAGHAEVLA